MLCCLYGMGQRVSVGEVLAKKYKQKKLKFCVEKGKVYVLNTENRLRYILDIYDKEFMRNSKTMELPKLDYDFVKALSINVVNDKLCLFVKATNKFESKTVFYAIHMDLKAPDRTWQAKEMKYSIKKDYHKLDNECIAINTSKNMIFMIQSTPIKSKQHKELVVGAYDTDFNLLYDMDLYAEENILYNDMQFDNKGNFYILQEHTDKASDLKKKSYYTIRQYLWETNEFKTHTIALPDAYISSVKYAFNSNDELIGSAYYGMDKKGNIDGVVSFKLMNSAQGPLLKMFNRKVFGDEIKEDLLSGRDYKNNKSLKNYRVQKVLSMNDSTFVTIGEYVKAVKSGGGGGSVGYHGSGGMSHAGGFGTYGGSGGFSVYSGGNNVYVGGSSSLEYEKKDILVHCTYNSGNYSRPQYIAKKQKRDDKNVGVKCYVKNNQVHILFHYLDLNNNMNILKQKPKDLKEACHKGHKMKVLVDCVVDVKGIKSYKIIDRFKKIDDEKWPIKDLYEDLDQENNIFLFKNEDSKKFGLVKIEF